MTTEEYKEHALDINDVLTKIFDTHEKKFYMNEIDKQNEINKSVYKTLEHFEDMIENINIRLDGLLNSQKILLKMVTEEKGEFR